MSLVFVDKKLIFAVPNHTSESDLDLYAGKHGCHCFSSVYLSDYFDCILRTPCVSP